MYYVGYRPSKNNMMLTITEANTKLVAEKRFKSRGKGFPPLWVHPIQKSELKAAIDLQFAGWRGSKDKFKAALEFAKNNPDQFVAGRIF